MILITGGTGFIGRHVALSLAEEGHGVAITHRRAFQVPEVLREMMGTRIKSVRCDVLDLPGLVRAMRDHEVDSVIHAAHISPYEASLYQVVATDVQGSVNVMEAASLSGVRKITYVSSGTVAPTGTTDSFSRASRSAIDAVKKTGEILLSFLGQEYGVQVQIVRPSLIYGPYCESEIEPLRILRDMVEGVAKGNTVDVSRAPTSRRFDLVYVRDCGRAIGRAHTMGEEAGQVVRISSGKPVSFREVASSLMELVPTADIRLGPAVEESSEGYPVSDQAAAAKPLFTPVYSLREGLSEYLQWYRSN